MTDRELIARLRDTARSFAESDPAPDMPKERYVEWEAADRIAALLDRLEDYERGLVGWKEQVLDFAKRILHGDDEHRNWLTEAAQCFVDGNELPPPRGKGAASPAAEPQH